MFTVTFRGSGGKKSRRLARSQTATDSPAEALAFAGKVLSAQTPKAQAVVVRIEIERTQLGNAAVTWEPEAPAPRSRK